jgi:hypothetical protein
MAASGKAVERVRRGHTGAFSSVAETRLLPRNRRRSDCVRLPGGPDACAPLTMMQARCDRGNNLR